MAIIPGSVGMSKVMQGTIISVDTNKWVACVYCKLTSRYYSNVQVLAPYLHHFSGEGMYFMPAVGATCSLVCPSDSSAPYIEGFLAPAAVQQENPTETTQEDDGSADNSKQLDWSYNSNRPSLQMGESTWRGRDGGFIAMKSGGILAVGANELSQRIHIPLHNQLFDIAENYEMQNSGGTVRWGMKLGQYIDRGTQYLQTFRISADSKYADFCLKVGTVFDLMLAGDDREILSSMNIGTKSRCLELSYAPGGFNAIDGTPLKGTEVSMQYFVDLDGNSYLRHKGSMLFSVKGSMKLSVKEDLTVEAKSFKMTCSEGATVGSSGGTTKVIGSKVAVGGSGGQPIARQGDSVQVFIPPGVTVTGPMVLSGLIVTGSATNTAT